MSTLPLFLLFSLLGISNARFAAKRSASPPHTLVIPVGLDENQVYSVMVNMSSNPSPQSFSLALTTSTAFAIFFRLFRLNVTCFGCRISTVAGASCDSCGGVPSYNPSASSSAQQLPQSQDVVTLNGNASGSLVRENCGLLQSNGSAWSYPNQTVAVANQSASFFSPNVSGMLGMGMAPFADSPAANWLARNPDQPTFSYGMALNPPSNFTTDGGVLHWLQPDQSFYEGEVQQKTMLTANASNSNLSSWFVEMDEWSATGSSSSPFNITQSGVQLLTFLDPLYASIVFPQGAARSIYEDIPGASKHATSAFAHSWKLPCDAAFTLTVTFGSFSTSLDQSSLVVKQADGLCVGAIQEWIDPNATEYLLGSPFIAVLYLIFSYSQSGQGSMGLAARAPPSSKLTPAVIAGVVLGSVAVVALLVIAGVLVCFVCQRRSKKPRVRKHSKTDITPFPSNIYDSSHSCNSVQTAYSGRPYSPRAGLLDDASNPTSPDWGTMLLTAGGGTETNTFPGGTTFNDSHDSHANYHTDMHSSAELINLDSPPPYAIPGQRSMPPVPLVPLRKNRRPLDS
ncbi:aspartic peptidase domain-containing protein [Mycena maculata]|uniref:Aspartic peptidase domain-containing protein n=1 Tax=Mycena maculata TaxID=230809 RepID=A0AAD7JWS3_9AGAR|nr:aspartic peptidase domain-containing protein [Mycena maculata]